MRWCHLIAGTKREQVNKIRQDMVEFKRAKGVDRVIVLWTANTERFSEVVVGLNDTQENLNAAIDADEAEISPSTLFAMACIEENVPFINGSPQNTFVPGCMEAAIQKKSLIAGDDFKVTHRDAKQVRCEVCQDSSEI